MPNINTSLDTALVTVTFRTREGNQGEIHM